MAIISSAVVGLLGLYAYALGRPPAPPVTASASLVRAALAAGGARQVLSFSIVVRSRAEEPMELVEVLAYATTAGGATVTMALPLGGPVAATAATLASPARLALPPGGSQTLYVNLTAPASDPVTSVAFEVVFVTSGNSTVAACTNAVKVPSP